MVSQNRKLFPFLAISALACWVVPLWADDTTTLTMDALTVRVISKTSEGFKTGSGFFVGNGSLVVTNLHVVSNATEIDVLQGQRSDSGTRQFLSSPASLLHISQVKDLAILKLEQPFSSISASFNLKANLVERQKVCVVGFPGAADQSNKLDQIVAPKFTDGIVSAFVTFEEGVRAVQTDAAVNPGNSGGPLFNECGEVIGIVVRKALTQVMAVEASGQVTATRVSEGEGIGWAVLVDELIPELDQAGIKPNIVDHPCDPKQMLSTYDLLSAIALLLAVAALVFVLSRSGRKKIREVGRALTQRESRSPPVLRCLMGPFVGDEIPLTEGKLVIGRDPAHCHIVIGEESDKVSKRHCALTVALGGAGLFLEDLQSTNGTFLKPDTRLQAGQLYPLLVGATFYLGDEAVVFQIE